MKQAYLTIDDSPTPYTDYILDALSERGVPALLFARGDMMDAYGTQSLVRAVRDGFHIGNHMVTHTRTSTMNFDNVQNEIIDMHNRITDIYHAADEQYVPRYFRFPHMDRGTGGWVIDYNKVPEEYRTFVTSLFADGLNVTLDPPTEAQIEQKKQVQEFLTSLGYAQPFHNINFPWYQGEMKNAVDCMYTYSTSDWMVLNRHVGKWKYKTIDDLKRKIDDDQSLKDHNSRHIILAHDKDEVGFNQKMIELVDYFLLKECEFLPF